MSGPTVLLLPLLACLHVSIATYCNYRAGLIDNYLADKDNLYCFDGGKIEIGDFSKLCSDTQAFQSARQDDMSVLCAADNTLVGYNNYQCDDNGVLAAALVDDDVLTPYSKCVADADVAASVCTGVDVAADTSKLLVDQSFSGSDVVNVDLVAPDATDIVYYKLVCDDTHGFPADVEGPVYGYCSGNSDGNVFSLHTDSTADGCYELCPKDPTIIDESPANFNYAEISEPQRSGSIVSAGVVCAEGFALAHTAAKEYEFTCTGVKEGDSQGTYSCGENCPLCLAGCPANPSLDQITNSGDVANLATVDIGTGGATGETVIASVTCAEGFKLGKEAPVEYDFLCTSLEDNIEANSGTWTIVNDLPECKPICGEDKVVDIETVKQVIISGEAGHGEVKTGTVLCDDGFSFEFGDDNVEYEFKCFEGEFSCNEDCPVCYSKCSIPAENEIFSYNSGGAALTEGDSVLRGQEIEVKCKNEDLNVVGAKFMICNEGGELVFDGDAPECMSSDICEAPSVVNGNIDTRNNIQIGESYKVMCKSMHWFDAVTATTYGDGKKGSFHEISIECKGEVIPDLTCYVGCLSPDIKNGVTSPDMSESGSAPFEIGAKVTFSCLDGLGMTEGQAEATCDAGEFPLAVCGASSLTISLLLAVSLLLALL